MDFTMVTDNFVLIVMIACLVIGYIIKHASFLKWIPNNDIPAILALLGAIVNTIVSGVSVESVVYGALMGLSSTGLHQAFTKFVENNKNDTSETESTEK